LKLLTIHKDEGRGMKPSRGFVKNHVDLGDEAQVDTDSSFGYRKLPNQSVVKYSAHEYVRGDVHANGIESMWSMFKRAHKGV